MEIKLICSDLDGTLLNSEGTISEKNINVIREAYQEGIQIVLASGRPYESLRDFSDNVLKVPTYKISFNGAQVHSPKSQLIDLSVINNSIINNVIQIAEDYQIAINLSTDSKWINFSPASDSKQIDKFNESLTELKIGSLTQFEMLCTEREIRILKVGMYIDNPKKLQEVYNALKALKLNVFQADSGFIEATSEGVSKYRALVEVCQLINIDVNQVLAFGDYENDYEMLTRIKYGVAMGNAMDELKRATNFITKTNDEDGVAYVIESIIENDKYPFR